MNKEKLYELKAQRAEAVKKAGELLDAGQMEEHQSEMERVKGFNGQIKAVEKLLEEQERFADQGGVPGGNGGTPTVEKAGEGADPYEKAVKSFAQAARKQFRVEKAAGDMMQEQVDADGGYIVPQDIVTRIIKLRDAKESLLSEVTVVPVRTKSGRRTFQKRSQHTGFSTVAEGSKYSKVAGPQFSVLSYNIEKRGGVLPVTQELMEDSDNNISAVAEEWLGDEARVTGNKEILAVIQAKSQTDLVDLDGILAAWVGLGSTFRATSKLITNDDGLLFLGTLKDQNGRYLLTPNPAQPQQLQLVIGPHVLPVKTYDNDTIPSSGTKIPMILGDLKEGVVYWDRRQFTIRVSDVAVVGNLNAFEQDLILWKGSLRDDCTERDGEAYIYGYIDTAPAPVPDPDDGGGSEDMGG